ncbi:MAG: carbohydrate ABC transporter permease [Anaerolineae bacterium]|nr:carbohydrate ABC transporter permease [Anaerolineae bacterium]
MVGGGISYVVIGLYTLLSVYPFLWMVSASFKEPVEVYQNQSLIPWNLNFNTWISTWGDLNFFTHFLNTVILTMVVVLGVLLIYSLAGYGFAVLPFRGRNVVFVFFLSMLLVPGVTILIPLYVMLRLQVPLIGPDASYLSTYVGLALPMINGAGPFAIFLFRNYFRTIPAELRDAALVDGCSEVRIYWSIYMPLALPAMATIGIMNFLASWNAYVWPSLVLTKPEWLTLPLKLRELDMQIVIQWNVRMAGSLFTVIPIILVFLLLQALQPCRR